MARRSLTVVSTAFITLLVLGFTPTYAAGIAILSVIGASWLTPRRMNLKAITDALALGSRNMITTGLMAIGFMLFAGITL